MGIEWQRQVGSDVRRLRKAAGFTQEALGDRAGLAMRCVSGIERGEENPLRAALVKLAAALEAHLRDLFADQR